MTGFTNSLKTEWLPSGGHWRLTESFEFHSGEAGSGMFIRCEEGMVTDLASIPWFARWLVPKVGMDAQASVVHDRGYRDGFVLVRIVVDGVAHEKRVAVSRGVVDSIYMQAMRALKTKMTRREAIYRAIQVGGWVVWNKYRRAGGMTTETTA